MEEDIIKRPAKKDDELVLECVNIGKYGDAIFKMPSGYTIIAAGAVEGEICKLKITAPRETFGYAVILEKIN